jgi:hypothetical protein
VTNRRNSVVLITGAKTTVISPDDMDGFLGEIRAAVPEFTPSDPILDAMGTYPAGSLPGKLIGWTVALVALSIAALTMLYSPGPPGYTLTPDSLTIHDRFYPVTLNAGGKTIRMYRTDSKRLVLLPPAGDGTPVLLETKDPEEFVREVRQEWSHRS